MMESTLKILMIEDNFLDAELIKREIKKNEIRFVDRLVETKEEMLEALEQFKPDIILSDYSLPAFDGMKALKIRQERAPDIPFILVTGSINEETAVEVMKAGADDYILKGHIARIGSAIKAALEKKEAVQLQKQSEQQLRILSRAVEQSPASILITDTKGDIQYINHKFTEVTGFTSQEAIGKNPRILKSELTSKETYQLLWASITSGKEWHGEFVNRKKNGELFYESALIAPIANEQGDITHFLGIKENITEKKKAQLELERNHLLLKKALVESTNLIDVSPDEMNYQRVVDTMRELSGADFVHFNLFEENGTDFFTIAYSGLNDMISKGFSLLGFDLTNKKWSSDPWLNEQLKDHVIVRFNSVLELAGHVLPKSICKLLDTTFKITGIYIVSVRKNTKTIGDFTLVFTNGNQLYSSEIVSIFANQIGLFIDRKKAEDALLKKMEELERFHRLTVDREVTMIELKKEINALLKSMGKEPKYTIVE
ncbi:MAG: PAS domain S-box protein [Microbacter sp.]